MVTENTAIEWCTHSFNPWWGCDAVSPGCDHCYARTLATRVGARDLWTGQRRFFGDKHWREPVRWNARAQAAGVRERVFCASMADVFDNHLEVHGSRQRLFRLIRNTPSLDWLLLTKRIGNAWPMMLEVMRRCHGGERPMENVWLGITVVNQAEAERDIPKLLATPAHIRFLSIEPMLEPIDLTGLWSKQVRQHGLGLPLPADMYAKLHWIIAGGESGHHARAMHPAWVRSLRDQCQAAGVAFHFKQWGNFLPADQREAGRFSYEDERCEHQWDDSSTGYSIRVGAKEAGRMLDGREWLEFPEAA